MSQRVGLRISSSTTPFLVHDTSFDLWIAILLLSCLHLPSRMEPQPFSSLCQKTVSTSPFFKFGNAPTSREQPLTIKDCNRLDSLHGGCTATVFDLCTTTALAPIAKPGYWDFASVSRTLNVTYLRPARAGERLLVISEVVHAGKRSAILS